MNWFESESGPYKELGILADKLLLKRDNTYNRAIDFILENNVEKYKLLFKAAKNIDKELKNVLKGLSKKL